MRDFAMIFYDKLSFNVGRMVFCLSTKIQKIQCSFDEFIALKYENLCTFCA